MEDIYWVFGTIIAWKLRRKTWLSVRKDNASVPEAEWGGHRSR